MCRHDLALCVFISMAQSRYDGVPVKTTLNSSPQQICLIRLPFRAKMGVGTSLNISAIDRCRSLDFCDLFAEKLLPHMYTLPWAIFGY